MDRVSRKVAEAKMNRNDRRRAGAFLSEDEDEDAAMPVRRRRKRMYEEELEFDDDEVMPLDADALRDVKGPLSEYVLMEAPSRSIRNEFHRFLTSFVNEHGHSVYGDKIKAMCEAV